MLRYIEGYKNSKKDNREVVDPVTTYQACFQACFKVPMEPLSMALNKILEMSESEVSSQQLTIKGTVF